jgi:hypothetical protein
VATYGAIRRVRKVSKGENEFIIEHLESKLARGTVNGHKFKSVLNGRDDNWHWKHQIEGLKGNHSLHVVMSRSLDMEQRERALIERDKRMVV